MTLPRCGVRDTLPALKLHAIQHYNYFKGKPRWLPAMTTTLTYAFSPNYIVSNLNLFHIKLNYGFSDIKIGFYSCDHGNYIVSNLNLFDIKLNYGFSDIKIGFYSCDHGDGEPFDGVLGVLAHGFSPESGKLHLDAAETWAVDFDSEKSKAAIHLESVVTHEIGHVLVLADSFVKESVMYPSLKPREKKIDLKVDDIKGIQQLYESNPEFNIESLSQSDTSSNDFVDSKLQLRLSS